MITIYLQKLTGIIWNYPVIGLCFLGGIYFSLRLRFIQLRCLPHAIALLRGKYDKAGEHGEISHFQALSAALSATVGLGNIAGVSVAIAMGGPGAVFWMWITGFLAMATKYVECTLGTHYRHEDIKTGEIRGGAMYYIRNGLGKKWQPMAIFFAICLSFAAITVGSMFQSNQAAAALNTFYHIPVWLTGTIILVLGALVIIGGISRIGKVASTIVPFMCGIYITGAIIICLLNIDKVPLAFMIILQDAFTGQAAAGGAIGTVIFMGIRRATFSNEAGLGSAPIAHAAVKTDYPVREGIVAALEPFIDTIVVCSATAIVIILSGNFGTEIFQPFKNSTLDLNNPIAISASKDWQIKNLEIENKKNLQSLRNSNKTLYYNQSSKKQNSQAIIGPLTIANRTNTINNRSHKIELSDGIRFSYKQISGTFSIRILDQNKKILGNLNLEKNSSTTSPLFAINKFIPKPGWNSCIIQFKSKFKSKLTNANNNLDKIYLELIPEKKKVEWYFDRIQSIKKLEGIDLTTHSFDKFFKGFGSVFITIAVCFFAFSTLITWAYYGETCAAYVFGHKIIPAYRLIYVLAALLGSILTLDFIINLGDLLLGIVVIPNFIAILLLSNKVRKWTKDYFYMLKNNQFN
jgi:alanine or glycine:cation symporter, AGCS family